MCNSFNNQNKIHRLGEDVVRGHEDGEHGQVAANSSFFHLTDISLTTITHDLLFFYKLFLLFVKQNNQKHKTVNDKSHNQYRLMRQHDNKKPKHPPKELKEIKKEGGFSPVQNDER